jgi:predicted esterase
MLNNIVQGGIDSRRIALGGFSQGAVLSLAVREHIDRT